ncbi:MAG TPA: hypothetical protein VF228_00825 [Iamia sp.]
MAGGAGLAAGAVLLGAASPAGADSLDDYDFDGLLVAVEGGGPVPVDLGTGGAARADFVAEGEIAAMTFRLILGANPDPGDDFWAIQTTDFPSAFEPVGLPDPADPDPAPPVEAGPFPLAFGWAGSGFVVDEANSASSPLIPIIERFPASPTFMAWVIASPTGIGGLNSSGTVPFVLAEGTIVSSTLVYRRIVPEE